ncbi:MAG TPA: hypothetical protein VMK12_16005 [Anaeromyxobacteraceae bacterium]|nr:hypothetical protein [Anaeromyxobacteraceae bacterium]
MTAAGVIHQYAFGDLRCRIVVLRIFTSYANGTPLTRIVKTLNEESVPGAIRAAKGMVASNHQPDPRQREIRRAVGLEQDGEPTRS